MKKSLFFCLVLIIGSSVSFAQNWKPLNLTDKYNFQFSDSAYISNTLWIDSVNVENGDSAFHLNRIVIICDTCTLPVPWYPPNKLANQGQFLQKKMIQKSDGSFHFEGNRNFIIHTQKGIGETWNFDTLNDISAQISDKNQISIFGQIDSSMTISLSNGDSILLSKNHGFIEFPQLDSLKNFELVGIEGRDLGELVPDFWDIFDFESGDVFQHLIWESFSNESNRKSFIKREILGKSIINDSVIYEVNTHRMGLHFNFNWWIWDTVFQTEPNNELWIFTDDNPIHSGYNNQKVFLYEKCFNSVFAHLKVYKDSQGIIVKDAYEYNENLGAFMAYYEDTENPEILVPVFDCIKVYEFGNKTGLIICNNWEHEYSVGEQLLGYVKGGDTTGMVLPDDDFISGIFTPQKTNLNFRLSPNPSKKLFRISFTKPISEDLNLEVFNASGQMIFQTISQKGSYWKTLDLSAFPKGVYYLKMIGEKSFGTSKLIKM